MLKYVIRHNFVNHLFLHDLDKNDNPIWGSLAIALCLSKDAAEVVRSFAKANQLMKVVCADVDIDA